MALISGIPLNLLQELFLSQEQRKGLEMRLLRLFPGLLMVPVLTVEVGEEKWGKRVD